MTEKNVSRVDGSPEGQRAAGSTAPAAGGARLERRIEFTAAYDKRSTDPKKNYGIHGCDMRWYLIGPDVAIQFVVYTNWHLPHVTREQMSRPYDATGGDPHWMERPLPADIGYHSRKPAYEGQSVTREDCHVLGGPCYYDGSSLQAEAVFRILLAEGSDGVWREMERRYADMLERIAEAGVPAAREAEAVPSVSTVNEGNQ